MTIGLTVLALVAAGGGVAVVVRAARAGRVTAGTVVRAVLVAGGVTLLGASLGAVFGTTLGFFGLVHLMYLAAVVTVPIVGVAVLGGARVSSGSTAAVALGALMLLPAPVGVYATHIAPFSLRVERLEVPVDARRAGEDTVRIAVLSDLQTVDVGRLERAAVRAVLDAEPDVILIPGDLFQGRHSDLVENGPELRELLGDLEAPGGVFFVEGDVDRGDRVRALLPGTGIQVLDDRVVRVSVGDRQLLLGGTRKDYASPAAAQVRDQLASAAAGPAISVLMSHRPDTVLGLPPSAGVDLTVAGHTHGGQVALPGLGPLVTLSEVPRRVGAGGLHDVDGNRIYVSTGVGMERGEAPQLRFGVRPSVAVLDLVAAG